MMEITTMPDPGPPLHLAFQTRQMWMGIGMPDAHQSIRVIDNPRALRKRTPSGGYEVSDADLVRAIRVWDRVAILRRCARFPSC